MALPVMNAAPTNTYLEPTNPSVKESLADTIYMIDSDETPFVSMIDRVGAEQTLEEWLVQTLGAAANVPQPEGFTALMSPANKTVRNNNVCQILARTVAVSGTNRATNQVGEEEFVRQMLLRGREVRRDLELATTSESIKTTADPRAMAGFQTWCTLGSVGAGTGAFPAGDGTNGHTAGTLRDLTITMVEDALMNNFNAGQVPSVAIMSANIKRYFGVIAAQAPSATNPIVQDNILQATTPAPVTINGAVDVYRSNFGTLQLVPDRFIPAHVIELVSPEYVELAPLRDFDDEELGKTGDNTQGMIIWEGTLRVTAPKAHSCIWDLNQ